MRTYSYLVEIEASFHTEATTSETLRKKLTTMLRTRGFDETCFIINISRADPPTQAQLDKPPEGSGTLLVTEKKTKTATKRKGKTKGKIKGKKKGER